MPLLAVGTAVAAYGAIQQGRAAAEAANFNRENALRNARISREQAARDAEAQGRRSRKIIGAMRAGYGASGITLEGSPLDVLEESAATAELDRQNIIYRGELRAMGYTDTAALEGMRADSAMESAYYGAGSAILMGAGRMGGISSRASTGYELDV